MHEPTDRDAPKSSDGDSTPDTADSTPRTESGQNPSLSLGWRIFFLISGWILLLIGIAGLALPGIQGILTILLGLALLGLVSNLVHGLLERLMKPWPRAWNRMEELRRKIFEKLS